MPGESLDARVELKGTKYREAKFSQGVNSGQQNSPRRNSVTALHMVGAGASVNMETLYVNYYDDCVVFKMRMNDLLSPVYVYKSLDITF